MHSLKTILTLLARHHQRTTYGALAALLRKEPRNVLAGCPRDYLHCWVVNQETGQPTAYPAGMIHPALEERAEILGSAEALLEWLQGKGYEGQAGSGRN